MVTAALVGIPQSAGLTVILASMSADQQDAAPVARWPVSTGSAKARHLHEAFLDQSAAARRDLVPLTRAADDAGPAR